MSLSRLFSLLIALTVLAVRGERLYKPDTDTVINLHGQLWEHNEAKGDKEYKLHIHVLDRVKPIAQKVPLVEWRQDKHDHWIFTVKLRFNKEQKKDESAKHVDQMEVQVLRTVVVKYRAHQEVVHSFVLEGVSAHKYFALDLTTGEEHVFGSELEREHELTRRQNVTEEEVEEEDQEWEETELDHRNHSEPPLTDHELELLAHRAEQMEQARKNLLHKKGIHALPPALAVIQGVVWDEEGLIIEEPFIKLVQDGNELNDYEVLSNGNGFFEIELYAEHQGTLKIVYGKDEEHAEGFVEDLETLFKASYAEHEQHDAFHRLQHHDLAQPHRRILHMHYHGYGPYVFAYHIYGVVLRLDEQRVPHVIMDTDECKDCPFIKLEYTSEHEHSVHKNIPAELHHNMETGEFRITIRNGYGLDMEKRRRKDHDYGKINVIVALNRAHKDEGSYEAYTVDVVECIRRWQKRAEILFLYADKHSMSFEKFEVHEAVARKLTFQIRAWHDEETEGQCQMLAKRPPNGRTDAPWLTFRDKAGNQMPVAKHVKQSGFQLSEFTYLVEVVFRPTLVNHFFVHIDCALESANREDEPPEIVSHASFLQLKAERAKGEYPLVTAPLRVDKIEYRPLPQKKEQTPRTHKMREHKKERLSPKRS